MWTSRACDKKGIASATARAACGEAFHAMAMTSPIGAAGRTGASSTGRPLWTMVSSGRSVLGLSTTRPDCPRMTRSEAAASRHDARCVADLLAPLDRRAAARRLARGGRFLTFGQGVMCNRGIEGGLGLGGIRLAFAVRHGDQIGGDRRRNVRAEHRQSVARIGAHVQGLKMGAEALRKPAGGFDRAGSRGATAERNEDRADRHVEPFPLRIDRLAILLW